MPLFPWKCPRKRGPISYNSFLRKAPFPTKMETFPRKYFLGNFMFSCSAFVAELWEIYEGLRLVHKKEFRKVELHIDSEVVVLVLKKGASSSSLGCSLLQQIWHLLEMYWLVEISHTYREAIKCADALANKGCFLDYNTMFHDSCPPSIRDVFNFDLLGNTAPRLIAL